MNRRMVRSPVGKKPPLCSGGFGLTDRSIALPEFDRADRDLAAARIVLRVELHLLAFAQALDACALKRGGMNEDVLLSVVRLNEAEALFVVVELHGARNHGNVLSL